MGWNTSKLGDACEMIKRGVGPKYLESGGVCVINQKCVRDHQINYELARRHDLDKKKVNEERYIKVGDVLVNSTGTGTLGRVAQIRAVPAERTTVDTHVTIVRPKPDLFHNDFFGYMLIKIEEEITAAGEGASGQTELARTKLENEFIVSYPDSIPEQKRIVAILDQAFADIEQARAKTEKNLKNARELFESYLQQVFSNQIDNCVVRSMSDKTLLTMIDGDRGKNYPKKSEFLSEGHCLFLSTKNVRSDGFLFEQTMFITEKLDSLLRKGKLERNDVVLTTRGTIGNLALYDDTVDYENIRINSGMLILRPNVAEILPSYLFEIMRSEIIRSQIETKVSGAAQPQLPVNTLNTFTFPVPQSLDDQLKAVELIREAEVTIKKLIRIYNDKLASLDELKKSILQKAFSGELTKTLEVDTNKGAVA